MSQIQILNGDLYIIFKENKNDVLISYRLHNGAEFDFFNNELIQLVLPNFERQLNRGPLSDVDMELLDVQFDGTKLILPLKIVNDTINISLDCSSMEHKF